MVFIVVIKRTTVADEPMAERCGAAETSSSTEFAHSARGPTTSCTMVSTIKEASTGLPDVCERNLGPEGASLLNSLARPGVTLSHTESAASSHLGASPGWKRGAWTLNGCGEVASVAREQNPTTPRRASMRRYAWAAVSRMKSRARLGSCST